MKIHLVTIALGLLTLAASGDLPRVGDMVKVSSQNPLVVLGKAQVTAISSNTVTVTTDFDSYTFLQTNVVIVPLVPSGEAPTLIPGGITSTESQAQASAPASSAPQSGEPGSNTTYQGEADPGMALLGKFSGKIGYANAVKLYQDDMAKVKSGQMDVNQLCAEAEQTIKEADQYDPEREQDPEYEQYIASLREFVRRVKAGEKFDFPVGPQAAAASIP